MRELRKLVHLHRRGCTLEGMRSAKYLIDGVVIARIVLQHEDVAFQGFDLHFRLGEEVL